MATIVSVSPPQREIYQGWYPCMEWCRDNCRGHWAYQTEGVFEFELDSDCTAFLLKWG